MRSAPRSVSGRRALRGVTAIAIILLYGAALARSIAGDSTSYCRLTQIDGRWFFTAAGKPFLSKGVDHVTMDHYTIGDTQRGPYREWALKEYGSVERWRKVIVRQLFDLGYNTLGAWSDPEIAKIEVDGKRMFFAMNLDFSEAYVEAVDIAGASSGGSWLNGIFPDVFDPKFEEICNHVAREKCPPLANNGQLLGWFADNELRWGPDWRGRSELLVDFLNLPKTRPGRVAAIEFLKKRYASFEEFDRVWKSGAKSWIEFERLGKIEAPFERKELYFQNQEVERVANDADPRRSAYIKDCEDFLGVLSEKYFRVTTGAIRRFDANHLVFGARFAYVPPSTVIARCAEFVDAISFNCYDDDPSRVIERYAGFKKPLIIGEFSFRAKDSGLPNTKGAGPVVETQRDRASDFEKYVRSAMKSPLLVGYHWFEFCDEPAEGRFDGENSNYGIFDIGGGVYETLAETMRRVNKEADGWHAATAPKL